jgi:hypothetical protein
MERLLACLASVALLSACGQAATGHSGANAALVGAAVASPSAGPPLLERQGSTPVWKPTPAGPGEIIYPGFGIRTKDTPSGTGSVVSNEQAQKITQETDFFVQGLLPGTPTVSLKSFSNTDVPPGEVVTAPIVNRLVWMVTYDKSPADVFGGITAPGTSRPTNGSCIFVLAVDANSGTILDNFQSCHM